MASNKKKKASYRSQDMVPCFPLQLFSFGCLFKLFWVVLYKMFSVLPYINALFFAKLMPAGCPHRKEQPQQPLSTLGRRGNRGRPLH